MKLPFILKTSTKADGNLSLKWGKNDQATIIKRREFLQKHNLQLEDCIVMELEHEDRVVRVDAFNKPKNLTDVVKAEALITQDKDVTLFLLTADCLPIVLYDPVEQALALCHLGWKPTDKKLLPKVIQYMQEDYGTEPSNLEAFIGPGIHKESYRHTLPLKSDVELTALTPFVTLLPPNEVAIDLVGCNTAQLIQSGVEAKNIHINPTDTAVSSDYFSHYRSVRTGEEEGRFATIARLVG